MPKFFYGIILSVILLLLLYTFTNPSDQDPSSTEQLSSTEDNTEDTVHKKNYPTIVLDAGHGGFDPGKVGINGALEKDINLVIVKKLKSLLEKEGFTVYLTREKDALLAPANSSISLFHDLTLCGHQLLGLGKAHFFAALHMVILRISLELTGADAHKCQPIPVGLIHIRLDLEDEGGEIGAESVHQAAIRSPGQRGRGQLQEVLQERFNAEVGQG